MSQDASPNKSTMPFTPSEIRSALSHLRSADPVMKKVIRRVGPFKLQLQRGRFQVLVRSIISQQISTSAAKTIRQRLIDLVAPEKITPQSISQLSDHQFRSVGLSKQKTSYLKDLAERSESGDLRLKQIGRLSDERVIEQLTQVKGIGRWTAQMFLMFCLGRPDVFPDDDLGIRSAIRNLYELSELPDKSTSQEIAEPWRPYATVASWYCWRSLELESCQ